MFISHLAYRSHVSDFFPSKVETYWRAMELSLHTPWFMVSFRQFESDEDDGFGVGRTLLLADMLTVEQFFQEEHGPNIKIDSVQIVTPGHMNGSNYWKMDLLRAVWSAQEPEEEGQTADLFETSNGAWYAHSMLGTSIDDLKSRTIRFTYPSNTPQQHAASA